MNITKSGYFLSFLLSCIGGIFISSLVHISYIFIGELAVIAILLALWFKTKKVLLITLVILGLCLGFFRFNLAYNNVQQSPLVKLWGRSLTLQGTVIKVVGQQSSQDITLQVKEIKSVGKVDDQVLLKAPPFSHYTHGQKLKVKGKLQKPPSFEDFNYQGYLAKQGIHGLMYYPYISSLKKGHSSVMIQLKNGLSSTIKKNFSPPHSSLLQAITLGQKQALSSSFKQKLNQVGLSHITAISGMHIVIITELIAGLLLFIGLHRKYLFYVIVLILVLYLWLVGFRASIVRATIMGLIVFWGQKIGRPSASLTSLVIAGFLMLMFNPFLLRLDVGFQLSFMAVGGIILLKPILEKGISFLSSRHFIENLILITLAAQIAILPLVVYHFGQMSLVGVVSNILIVPVLPFLLGGAFTFLILGSLNFLQRILMMVLFPLVDYVVKVVRFLSQFAWASINFHLGVILMILFYLGLGFLVYLYRKKQWYLPV